MPLRLVGPFLLAALLATSGCTRAATQLLVVIESDLPAERIACVAVTVRPLDGASAPVSRVFFPAPDLGDPDVSIPFSLGVTPPGGDATRRVEIEALAIDRVTCAAGLPLPVGVPFVSRRVRTGFLAEQTLRLPIFLANDCFGVVCGGEETCEYGSCVPVPDIDPGTLVVTEAGAELLDAGGIDAAIEEDAPLGVDAGTDANVSDTGMDAGIDAFAPFAPSRPTPTERVTQAEADDPHGLVYPVGASPPDHFLLAGLTARGVSVGMLTIAPSEWPDAGPPRDAALTDALELDADLDAGAIEDADLDGGNDAGSDAGLLPAPTFFLAKLEAATRRVAWSASFPTEGAPYPVVRRMVRLPSGEYLACGTGASPFFALGRRQAGGSARWVFLLRLTPTGTPDAFLVLHAPLGSAQIWCQDLDVSGPEILLTARAWATDSLFEGSTPLPTTGTLELTEQSHVIARVRSTGSGLSLESAAVVGHAPLGPAQTILGLDGTASHGRAAPGGGWVLAVEADALDPRGAGAPSGGVLPRIMRVDDTLARVWELLPVSSAVLMGGGSMRTVLRALAVDDATVWAAITAQHEGGSSGRIVFGTLAPIATTRDVTFVLRIHAGTGELVSAVELPEGIEASTDDTRPIASARGGLLPGHALTTAAGGVLFAENGADGDPVGPFTLTVTPMAATMEEVADPVLAIVNASGAAEAVWQWDLEPDGMEARDWRLTHVEHVTAGFVAVAGYVENQSPDTWRRERSFFEILPAR